MGLSFCLTKEIFDAVKDHAPIYYITFPCRFFCRILRRTRSNSISQYNCEANGNMTLSWESGKIKFMLS